jgi:hypothetical protein
MKLRQIVERTVYALIVGLSLVALWLALNVPANFLNARVVYQGF